MGVASDGAKDTTSPLPGFGTHPESMLLCFAIPGVDALNPSHVLRQSLETSGFPAQIPGLLPEREEGDDG